jgi:hypothetical protein
MIRKPENDVFTFDVEIPETKETTTKRQALRAISTLFDPLQSGMRWLRACPQATSIRDFLYLRSRYICYRKRAVNVTVSVTVC